MVVLIKDGVFLFIWDLQTEDNNEQLSILVRACGYGNISHDHPNDTLISSFLFLLFHVHANNKNSLSLKLQSCKKW